MRLRPASLYRNFLLCGCGLLAIYLVFCVISYDDGTHIPGHKVQKHLYLTVSQDRIGGRFGKLAPKRILQWTTIFQQKPDGSNKFIDCPGFTDRCIVDSDKSRIDSADAVLFHSKDITYQPFPDQSSRKNNQKYVYMSMETPHNSGKYEVPNEIMSLPKNFFNWTATYLFSSDILFKYGPFWIPVKEAESKGFKVTSFFVNEKKLNKPNKGIFGLVSNCHTRSSREQALEALSKYVPVSIGGKCAKDKNLLDICPPGDPCDSVFESYPFFVAIENSVCNDYVTEKYWTRIHLASIPIVMRRKTYESSNPPPKSFIAMDDFKSAEEMGKYLNHLESNSTAYREYFAWRTGVWTIAPWNAPGHRNGWCRLCERLWENDQNTTMVEDVYKWFETESKCEKDEFVKQWI